ncbi:response regulator [Desulfobacula sp.]|uniref:response regulator n=1 Tax=Desulfobacula sp. TaxID=2593537 RepID=UPI0026137D0B|nr:response regulator [Desulfobacula sp.]
MKHMTERILVVDDRPMNIELLDAILTSAGYIVDSAESGEEALNKVFNDPPDLVLLDVMMPEMNGYEVCRRIKKNKSLPYIPIVYITASELEQEDVIKGLDAGGDDYIRKPFNMAELLGRIKSCLRVKSLYDELTKAKTELSRYVSLPTLKMVENKIHNHPEPENREAYVTIMFSDIREFTQISEGMTPADVFAKLNINIGTQLEIIEKYQGIIEKLNGDEVIAVFEGPDMADNALRCALEIIHALSKPGYNEELDFPYVGIGINTGQIYLGNVGNESFRDYTVIGNTINIAARLCGLADKFEVLLTQTTLASVNKEQFHFQSIGKKMLKGLSNPIEVFKVTR